MVGEADDDHAVIELARELPADVAIPDIGPAGANGVDAARRLMEVVPQLKMVALTGHYEKELVRQILTYGAAGYLVKGNAIEEVVTAVCTVLDPNWEPVG